MAVVKFEDCIEIIDRELEKRRYTWRLSSVSWMDFDDVAQKIRIHIHKKWHQYNPKRKLEPWINTIITNQIRNEIRNNYGRFSRPCANCVMDEGEELCRYTPSKRKCGECPLYAKWEKSRKNAYNIKMPLGLELHQDNVAPIRDEPIDIERALLSLKERLRERLSESEYKIFLMLYIDNRSEEEVAEEMGFKTSETRRKAGYRQIINYKRAIVQHAKRILEEEGVEGLWLSD